MTTMETADGPRFEIGAVISTTLDVLKRNLSGFMVVSAVFIIASSALAIPFQLSLMPSTPGGMPNFSSSTIMLGAAAIVVGLLASVWLQTVLIRAMAADLRGAPISPIGAIAPAMGMLLPMIGLGIVWGLGFFIGWILLLVPGIIVALMWTVAAPVMIIEGKGVFASLQRSRDLTRRHRWAILAVAVVFWVVYIVISMVISGVIGAVTAGLGQYNLGQVIASTIVGIPGAAVTTTGVTVIYWRLRIAKEGVAPDQLGSVFD